MVARIWVVAVLDALHVLRGELEPNYLARDSALACHLDHRELLEPCGGLAALGEKRSAAHGDEHPGYENGDIERARHRGRGRGGGGRRVWS